MQKNPATDSTAFLLSLVIMLLITAAPASLASPQPQGQTTPPGGTLFGPAPASSTAVATSRPSCTQHPAYSYCRYSGIANAPFPDVPVKGGTNSMGRNDPSAEKTNAALKANFSGKQENMQNMLKASSANSGE